MKALSLAVLLAAHTAYAEPREDLLDARSYFINEYFNPEDEDYDSQIRHEEPELNLSPMPVFSSSTNTAYPGLSFGYSLEAGGIGNIMAGEMFLVAMFQGSIITNYVNLNLDYMLTTVDFEHNILNGIVSIRNKAGLSADFSVRDFTLSVYANCKTRHSVFTLLDKLDLIAGARATYHVFEHMDVYSFYEHSWYFAEDNYYAGLGISLFL